MSSISICIAIDVNGSQVFIMPGLKVNKSEYYKRIKYPPSVYKNTIVNGVPKKINEETNKR